MIRQPRDPVSADEFPCSDIAVLPPLRDGNVIPITLILARLVEVASFSRRADSPLPHRDREPAQVRVRHQADLAAGQFQHRALLVGEHDGAGAAADGEAGTGRAVDARDVARRARYC